jgi:hypothetical protein
MQIQSIAYDHDIQYQQKDINRALLDKFDDLPAGLFLIRTASGTYYYAKEFSYALFASPFYKVLGNNGILFFNALMLFLMISFGYKFLRKFNSDIVSLAVSITFFIGSTAFVYIFWVHAEIYNMFLIALGLFLWHLYLEKLDIKYLIFTFLIVGLSVVAKAPNGIFFIPIILFELYAKRYKNFIIAAIFTALPILLFYGYFYFNTGVVSFYGGNRLSYTQNFPLVTGSIIYANQGTLHLVLILIFIR